MRQWVRRILDFPKDSLSYFIVVGIISTISWVGVQFWEMVVQSKRQSNEWELNYVTKQISELYGPLYFIIIEGRQAWDSFVYEFSREFGRNSPFIVKENIVFESDGKRETYSVFYPLTDKENKMWSYWKEHEFMPRNRKIQELLKTHSDLIIGDEAPKSYSNFLRHFQSWEINEQRLKETGAPYQGYVSHKLAK